MSQKEKVDLVINAALAYVGQRLLPDISVAVNNGVIVSIDKKPDILQRYEPNVVLNAENKLLLPGLVDSHTHISQQFLRGYLLEQPIMVWKKFLIPYESTLSEDAVYISAKCACLEMIKSGITGFADAGGPFPEVVCEAVKEMGLRAAITLSSMDYGDIPDTMKFSVEYILTRLEKLFTTWHGKEGGRIYIFGGIRQIMTSTPELINAINSFVRQHKTGLHLHLSEDRSEIDFCLAQYGRRPVEWLDEQGVLDNHVLAAHCIFILDNEAKILAKNQVNVAHCPASNLSGQGFPKVPELWALGTNISIASDGAGWSKLDLFELARLLSLSIQAHYGLPVHSTTSLLQGYELLNMITIAPAKACQFNSGVIEVGKNADLILIDLNKPHLIPNAENVYSLIVNLTGQDVSDVIINGKIVMKDREILCDDEEKIKKLGNMEGRKILKRVGII